MQRALYFDVPITTAEFKYGHLQTTVNADRESMWEETVDSRGIFMSSKNVFRYIEENQENHQSYEPAASWLLVCSTTDMPVHMPYLFLNQVSVC
jgi:hypothetical protein